MYYPKDPGTPLRVFAAYRESHFSECADEPASEQCFRAVRSLYAAQEIGERHHAMYQAAIALQWCCSLSASEDRDDRIYWIVRMARANKIPLCGIADYMSTVSRMAVLKVLLAHDADVGWEFAYPLIGCRQPVPDAEALQAALYACPEQTKTRGWEFTYPRARYLNVRQTLGCAPSGPGLAPRNPPPCPTNPFERSRRAKPSSRRGE